MSRFPLQLLFVSLVVLSVTGCGGDEAVGSREETVPLTGTLLVDGQPKGDSTVTFTPVDSEGGARTAYATTEADGSFEATTYVTGDGIVPGKYKISLGAAGDASSTDPAKMMAAVQGMSVRESEIDVPADGLTGIEIKLVSESGTGDSGAGGLLGQ